MSILAVESDPRGFVILMICWTALALVAALVVLVRERRHHIERITAGFDVVGADAPEALPPRAGSVLEYEVAQPPAPAIVPVFVMATAAGFGAWLLSQIAFAAIAPPRKAAEAGVALTPIELAVIMFLSAVCGWGATVLVLHLMKALSLAGYTAARLLRALGAGVVGIFVAIPLVYWTLQLTLWTWTKLGVEHAAKHPLLQSMEDEPARAVMILAALAAIVAAPLFEELLFRGLIQNGIVRRSRRPWLGIVLASVLFAVIHPAWTIPPIFVLSLLLGYVYHRTQNLWAATLMHALFNAFAMATSAMG